MAIKGKSRKRSRPKPPALPPRPSVSSRKTPFAFRREVKRAVVITLAILALLGGLRVWQNVSRADALKDFNKKLTLAQTKFIQHFAPSAPDSFEQNVQAFTKGSLGGPAIIALAETWETDFRAAVTSVAKLKAPNKVAEDSKFLMQQGLDAYVGIVQLYNLAGQVKSLADAEKDPKQKTLLQDKYRAILLQADDWRKQRADVIYTRGATKLSELNIQYGIQKRQTQSNTNPNTNTTQ